MAFRHLVVVPHTHWDREWHRTHEQFRYRLVRLIDGLLDLLEGDPDFRHFTLDGQSIVLEDYFEVRPEARERLCKLVRDGRLLVGPWYVLPDEWLVSGEALIRNLRLGLSQSEAHGAAMRLGYAPDLFGHVGQLPQIFAGFGFEAAVVWRGVGENVDESLFDWEAPDGTELLTVYLVHGYGNAVHLPLDAEALQRRIQQIVGSEERWARIPSLLLMNGSDHVEPQPGLPRALEAAIGALPDVTAELGTLPAFVERARRESTGRRPRHEGELRSGLRAPLLPGCASARMAQKRADFRNDVVLTRYVEPLAAWLGLVGGDPGLPWIRHAWRIALQNHPHDSICGCSTDEVHREIDARLARVTQMADSHLAQVADQLGARIRVPVGGALGDGQPLWVWNPHGAGPSCVDTELALPVPGDGRRPFHLRTPEGRRIPASVEPAGPAESLMDLTLRAAGASYVLDHLPDDFSGDRVRTVTWRRRGDHLDVDLIVGGCGPELDVAAAKERLRGLLASDDVRTARLRAQRPARARLRFVDELPSHGISVYRLGSGPVEDGPEPRASGDSGTGARISNEFFELTAHPDGRIDLLHRLRGVRSDDAVRIVSEGDRGDEYNFDPVPAGSTVDRPERVSVRTHASAAEARLDVDLWYRVPAALRADRAARSARNVSLPVRLRLRLARGLDRVDVDVEVENRARDHRLRLVVGCPFEPRRLRVESAFEVASRPLAPGPDAFGGGRAPAEYPIGAGPQRGFASLDDGDLALTVANRGGGEVEALAGTAGRAPGLALTLLRSVGWLSRGDLALRPGDAGPPLATPDAQVLGDHRLAFAIALHPAEDPAAWDRALRFCAPPLAVWGGTPDPEAPLAHGDRLLEIEDPRLLVSALEPCEGGGVSARLWNASDASVASPIRLAGVAPRSVDLAGRPARDGEVDALELEPWRIATFRS